MPSRQLKNSNPSPKSLADKAVNFCISLIVFFLPLFFYPFSGSVLELNKMFLFSLLTLIAFLVWLIRAILKKEIVLKRGFLNIFVIIFGFIYLFASLFSDSRFLSFMGNNLSHGSFIGLVSFILFYFLLINTVSGAEQGWRLLRLFLFSGLFVVIFNLAQIFGVYILPFSFSQNTAFNLVANSVSIFVIYLVTLFLIGFGFWLKSDKMKDRIFAEIFLVLVYALLFYLDKNLSWYLLILGLFFWLVFISMQSKNLKGILVVIPTIILMVSLFFLFVAIPSLTLFTPPTDLKIDYSTARSIAQSSLSHSFLFGSGPETFLYAFNTYRPASFNNSPLWPLRFDRSENEIFNLITTVGFFALLLFIIIPFWYLIRIGKNLLISLKVDQEWFFKATIFIGFLVLFFSGFLSPFSATTSFIFWFFLGLGGIMINLKNRRINLQKDTGINFGFSVVFVLLLIGAITFLYFGTRIWLSDFYSAKAQRVYAKTSDITQTRENIIRGVNFNPWLASLHIQLANNLVADGYEKLQKNESVAASPLFNQAKSEAEKALGQEEKNAAVYEQAGGIYQVINKAGGLVAFEEIKTIYEKAVQLDPNNAYLWLSFGNFYLTQAQNMKASLNDSTESSELKKKVEEDFNQSEEKLTKATQLKENYWEAELLLAQVLEHQGNRSKAVALLEKSLEKNPTNLSLLEENGKLLLVDNKLDEATDRFQTILALSPNHANARFWLATIYEQKGEKEKAITELEKVLKTNPTSSLVIQKISQLKGE